MKLTPAPKINCLICGKEGSLRMKSFDSSVFELPAGWMARSRDWKEDHPSQYQVVCNDACAKIAQEAPEGAA
jgi:hypothetical protein